MTESQRRLYMITLTYGQWPDWEFILTLQLFRYSYIVLIPEVVVHSQARSLRPYVSPIPLFVLHIAWHVRCSVGEVDYHKWCLICLVEWLQCNHDVCTGSSAGAWFTPPWQWHLCPSGSRYPRKLIIQGFHLVRMQPPLFPMRWMYFKNLQGPLYE